MDKCLKLITCVQAAHINRLDSLEQKIPKLVTVCQATFVPPVAGADAQSMAAAVQRIKAVLDMPLLHRAACSQSVPLVSPAFLSACPRSSPCSILCY